MEESKGYIVFDIDEPKLEKMPNDMIYEKYRRKKLNKGKLSLSILTLLSIILMISALFSIGLLQYDEYNAFINKRVKYIYESKTFCTKFYLGSIDLISTPIGILNSIICILLHKRRTFLTNRFKYKNIGLV